MSLSTLILMRHAKSSWDSDALTDYARPLSARGEQDAELMGRWLCAGNHQLQKILSSPAERARQTTNIIVKWVNLPSSGLVEWSDAMYGGGLSVLLELLNGNLRTDSLLMVGHNPAMESLVEYLDPDIGDRIHHQKLVPTASVFVFRTMLAKNRLSRGGGQLVSHERPKTVRAAMSFD
jgi:phosphohistidine phosphatase